MALVGMISNEEELIKDVYDFTRWLYFFTGSWRSDSPRKNIRTLYVIFKIMTYISYFFHVTTIYLGTALIFGNVHLFCFSLTYIIICNVGISKIILLEYHISSLKSLENRLDNDFNLSWLGRNEWEKEVKNKNAKKLKLCMKFVFITAGFGVAATVLSPVLPNSERVFIIPTPFDHLLNTPLFLPLYLFQEYSCIVFILAFISYDLVFVGVLIRLCDHLDIIKMNLREIELYMPDDGIIRESDFDADDLLLYKYRKCNYVRDEVGMKEEDWRMKEKHARVIKNCIAHHQAVYREVRLVSQIYSYTTFCYIFCGPPLMGILAYVILSGTTAMNILVQQACYAVPAGLFLFMQCYFGTQLSNKFEEVRFALYDCPWYKFDVKTRKLIVTALIAMEKTGKLRAGKFVDVALTTFLSSVKATYNIVTFLKNTS